MLKKVLVAIVLFISLLFGGIYYTLKKGIDIQNLSIATIDITALHLKLEKGFILSIKKLKVAPSKDESKTTFDPSYIGLVDEALEYIQLIQIDDIEYEKEHIFVQFKDKKFTIKHNRAVLDAEFELRGEHLLLKSNINLIKKKLNIDIYANAITNTLTTNIYSPKIDTTIDIVHKNFRIEAISKLQNGVLDYKINSNKIKTLKFVKEFVKLKPNISKLLFKNFSFSSVKIDEVSGKLELDKIKEFDIKSVYAKLTLNRAKFKYNKYPTIALKNLKVELKNGNIKANSTRYKGFNLVSLKLKTNSSIDGKKVNLSTKIYHKDIIFDIKADIKNDKLKF